MRIHDYNYVHYHAGFTTPVLDGDYVYWVEVESFDLAEHATLLRRRLPDRHCRPRGGIESGGVLGHEAPNSVGPYFPGRGEPVPNSLAVDGGRFYVADSQGVRRVTPQAFGPYQGPYFGQPPPGS
jgi:hypothetical protein